jgi:redox-sensitive bicupin YhaK (pirin superfamily)
MTTEPSISRNPIVLPADTRGHSKSSWLDSWHSFSFAGFHDPARMGLGPLRVLNDDRVAPGQGFGAHPHRDMEIVSYVLSGALAHTDSQGHGGTIKAGEAQFMRAGSGVTHSEMNASKTAPVHFLQIWVVPRMRGAKPTYDQRPVDVSKPGEWFTIASGQGEGIQIDQDLSIRTAKFKAGMETNLPKHPGRAYYAFVIEGAATVQGKALKTGDAIQLMEEPFTAKATADAHLLLFDVPLLKPRDHR